MNDESLDGSPKAATLTTSAANGPTGQQQQQQQPSPNQSADSAQSAPLNGTGLVDRNRTVTGVRNYQLTKPSVAPTFIDRHISTENEVLPSLETSPNRIWTTRFVRNLKSSLVYRFR